MSKELISNVNKSYVAASPVLNYDRFEFEYVPTEYHCPECKTVLTCPVPSSMLVCNEGHGPYFIA